MMIAALIAIWTALIGLMCELEGINGTLKELKETK